MTKERKRKKVCRKMKGPERYRPVKTRGINPAGDYRKNPVPVPTVLEICIRSKEIRDEWDPLTQWLRMVPRPPMPFEVRDIYGLDNSSYKSEDDATIPEVTVHEVW